MFTFLAPFRFYHTTILIILTPSRLRLLAILPFGAPTVVNHFRAALQLYHFTAFADFSRLARVPFSPFPGPPGFTVLPFLPFSRPCQFYHPLPDLPLAPYRRMS